MSKKRIVLFLCSIILLIVSEYLMLNELMAAENAKVFAVSCAGLMVSILYIIRFYNEWRNSLK